MKKVILLTLVLLLALSSVAYGAEVYSCILEDIVVNDYTSSGSAKIVYFPGQDKYRLIVKFNLEIEDADTRLITLVSRNGDDVTFLAQDWNYLEKNGVFNETFLINIDNFIASEVREIRIDIHSGTTWVESLTGVFEPTH